MQQEIDSSLWTGRTPRTRRMLVTFKVDITEGRGLWFWNDSFTPVTARITGFFS